MEKNAKTLRDERDKLNREVKELIDTKRSISERIGELHDNLESEKKKDNPFDSLADRHRKFADKLKDDKKKLVKMKKDVTSDLKKNMPKDIKDPSDVIKEIKRLDWIVQTEVLSAKKEDELSRKVIALEKKLNESKEYRDIARKIDELDDRIRNDEYIIEIVSDLVTDLTDKKFQLERKKLNTLKKLKKEHMKLKSINKQIDDKKKESDEIHGQYVGKIKERKEIQKIKDAEIAAKKAEKEKEDQKVLEKSAEDMITKLKKGKKITL